MSKRDGTKRENRDRLANVSRGMAVERGGAVRAIGDVLAELLAQYRTRFPEMNLMVVETPAETR